MTNEKVAVKVSLISIISNILLTVLKFFAGIFAHSQALISDAIHSLSDVLSTVIVIIGVKISSKEADDEHPYGHERMECIAAILLATMLFITGLGIGFVGIENIIEKKEILVPGVASIVAAGLSIVVKEAMYWYTYINGKKINSVSLIADAWHHRSDALSSIGSLIGVVGARMGYPIFDPIASIIICLFILKVAYDIFIDATNKLVDKACDEDVTNSILEIINSYKDVKRIDDLKTRMFGNKIYIDIKIALPKDMSLYDAHAISKKIHNEIDEKIVNVKHCMIHVNPYIK